MEPTSPPASDHARPGAEEPPAGPANPWATRPRLSVPAAARRVARNAAGAEVHLAPRADPETLGETLRRPRRTPWYAAAAAVAAIAAWALLANPADPDADPQPAAAPGDDAAYRLPFAQVEHDHDHSHGVEDDGGTHDPATMDLPPAPTTTVKEDAAAPAARPDDEALAGLDLPARQALAAAPSEVVVVGDSLTEGAEAHLEDMFDDADVPVRVDAARSRPTLDAVDALDRLAPKPGSLVVVALGTNDNPDPATYASRIDRVLAAVPDHSRVVWLTLDRDGWGGVNEALAAAAGGRHAARLEVADWAEVAGRHPGLVAADGVHYTSAGYRLRARFIANVALGMPTEEL